MLSLKCASMYSRTRLIAVGARPPRARGGGTGGVSEPIMSRRGRVCRAMVAALRHAPKELSGDVTSAARLSSPPTIISRVGTSLPSLRRKSERSRRKPSTG